MSTLLADVLLEEDNPSLVRNDAQELIPHTKVVLEDQASVKAALDEEVIRYLTDTGYEEDNSTTWKRLVMGYLSCAVALVGQFYPGEYPDTKWVLIVCITLFSILQLGMWYVAFFLEGGYMMFTKPARRGLDRRHQYPAVQVYSDMKRASPEYELHLQLRDGCYDTSVREQATWDVTAFFDVEGVFLRKVFDERLDELLAKFRGSFTPVVFGDKKND